MYCVDKPYNLDWLWSYNLRESLSSSFVLEKAIVGQIYLINSQTEICLKGGCTVEVKSNTFLRNPSFVQFIHFTRSSKVLRI